MNHKKELLKSLWVNCHSLQLLLRKDLPEDQKARGLQIS